ncbi:MAG: tetratricopeptide repeat protein [Verrucomicrobiota bacterium]
MHQPSVRLTFCGCLKNVLRHLAGKMRKAKSSASSQAAKGVEPAMPAPLSRGKKVAFTAVAALLSLILLEGLLAIFGVRPELSVRDLYVGFSSRVPLFLEQVGADGRIFLATAKNRLAFFNSQQFPKEKPPGVYRIFSMGGSTTYGHPYNDATSFNGWLREFLAATAPERAWEAINAGAISYGSERVVRLMQELVHYKPDLFIVYCGHNEFLERQIHREITKVPRLVRELRGLAGRLRTTTVMKRALSPLLRSSGRNAAPATGLEDEPVTLLDNTLGPSAFTRDEEWREQTLRRYQDNLVRMIDIARSVGARIMFITPASNLREASPFKSEHRKGVSDVDRRRWHQLYDQARQDYADSASPTNALAALDQAAAIDDLPASMHFVRGRVLEKLGRFPEAKASYERARDEDVCPLRALGRIRTILTRVAADRKVPLIDFEAFLEARSDHGTPGAAVFLDHVHPTIEGYRLLALEILKEMEAEKIVHPSWEPGNIQRVTQSVIGRIDSKAHSLALMNLCKVLGWAGKREEAYRTGAQAAKLGPDIATVRYEAGLAAQLFNRTDEAIEHYRRAVTLNPTHAEAHCALAVVLEDRTQLMEAIAHYRLAVQYGSPKNAERDKANLSNALAKLR